MAAPAAAKTNPPTPPPTLLTSIDMTSLTHSELLSLSFLSHPSSNDDVFSSPPTLHPPFFNPSGSSHNQTFSHSAPLNRRHRPRFSLLKQERFESNLIVDFLKQYLQLGDSASMNATKKQRKRRKREIEGEENVNLKVGVEIVNQNGVVVDLAALAEEERRNEGGPFGEELRRRAEGMEREEELLRMLAGMKGEWCSRRKKRRVVEACLLGDALPVGWKVIVALRRRAGRFFPYCRRYISPTGEHLSSCKEVSSYLLSYFGIHDASLLRDVRRELQPPQRVKLGNEQCINFEDGTSLLNVFNSSVRNARAPVESGKDASALGIDDLPEVQVSDHYECHTCNVIFDEKDKYLQHLLSFHQRTTRRYQLGSSVGGVTIKDGKYKCQLPCEVYEENRHYLVHVGHHVKDSSKPSDNSPVHVTDCAKLPCMDQLPNSIGISRMDALLKVARNSTQEISPCKLHNESLSVGNGEQPGIRKNLRLDVTDLMSENNLISCPSELEMKKGSGKVKTSSEELNSCDQVSGISSACQNKTEVGKIDGEDRTSLVELVPTCDKVSGILVTNGDINDTDASSIELEMENGCGQDKSSSKVSSQCVKVIGIPMTDGNKVDSTVNELEMNKDGGHGIFFHDLLNLHENESDVLMTDEETKEQALTCNSKESGKNFHFDRMTLPATESGLHAVNASLSYSASAKNERTTVGAKGQLNIHYPLCHETCCDIVGSGENIKSDYVDKIDPEQGQEDDDGELANVPGERIAPGHTESQKPKISSSLFDGASGEAGQDLCGHDWNLESETAPECMELDVVKHQMYNIMDGGDPTSLSMDMVNTTGIGLGLDSSVGSQSEFQLGMAGGGLETTFCVWCGIEFCHEVVDIKLQPDSVGFMCPTCRAKISQQFNELESNFSSNPDYY